MENGCTSPSLYAGSGVVAGIVVFGSWMELISLDHKDSMLVRWKCVSLKIFGETRKINEEKANQ